MPKHSTFQLYNPNHENDLPLPLYRRLANHYLSAMKAGTLVVGDRMPSVPQADAIAYRELINRFANVPPAGN